VSSSHAEEERQEQTELNRAAASFTHFNMQHATAQCSFTNMTTEVVLTLLKVIMIIIFFF